MLKSVKLNGKRYSIYTNCDGLCIDDERAIVINADLDTKNGMETAIHEALHAIDWNMSESKVNLLAQNLAHFLWQAKFRRQQCQKKIKT